MRGYLIPELGKIDQQIVAICDVDKRQLDSALQIKGLFIELFISKSSLTNGLNCSVRFTLPIMFLFSKFPPVSVDAGFVYLKLERYEFIV